MYVMKKLIKNKKVELLILAALLLIHAGFVLFWGCRKDGFHEDEYFSYWSAAGNNAINPGSPVVWTSGGELIRRFTVYPENRFAFDRVIYNQVQDVHPPLYYLALNIILSLRAGTFTKWYGIILNGLCSAVSLIFIYLIFIELEDETHRTEASVTALFYATAPSVMSCAMFIRMYSMSVMWNILYAYVIMRFLKCDPKKKKQVVLWSALGGAICYCAFLTHYFSLVVPFFLTAGAFLYSLFRKGRFVNTLIFGGSVLAGIGLAILTFPASLNHIFSEYRGTEAISGLKNDTLANRIAMLFPDLNRVFFAGLFWAALVLAVAGLVVFLIKTKEPAAKWFVSIVFAASSIASLFFLKSCLVLGASSLRYFCTAAFLFFSVSVYLILRTVGTFLTGKKARIVGTAVLAVLVFLPHIKGYAQGTVQFLFSEEREAILFSEKYAEYPLVVFYAKDNAYRLEYTMDQFWPFERVLLADGTHLMDSWEDPGITEAEKIVVYMDAPVEAVENIIGCSNVLTGYTLIRHDPFYYVYLLE